MKYYYGVGKFEDESYYAIKRDESGIGTYIQSNGSFLEGERSGIPHIKECKSYREMVGFLKTHVKGLVRFQPSFKTCEIVFK